MSSFGYLKNLELDMVKIDGSFVRGLEHDRMSQSIDARGHRIGHQQGLAVVAEWCRPSRCWRSCATWASITPRASHCIAPERAMFQRGTG